MYCGVLAMTIEWSVTTELSKAGLTQVFSGGACNVLNEEGKLLRNQERDAINNWLTSQRVPFFDPQIHPSTHGVEYSFPKHFKVEVAAREAAKVNLYEVSPHTFGGITSLEIAHDHFKRHEPMVIYYSDGDPNADRLPEHSDKGYPLFTPKGITSEAAMKAHYKEFVKNANNMRRFAMIYAHQRRELTAAMEKKSHSGDVEISTTRMHAVDLFRAVVKAASGKRVVINFLGDKSTRDTDGNPRMIVPENPSEAEMKALLDQYVDEGNELRKEIARLVEISVFVRVVFTQRSAQHALEELLKVKKVIKS
jgi:hypothetical protein